MTSFQENAINEINNISRKMDTSIQVNTYECEPNELIGHKSGDVYIKASITQHNQELHVYLYTDEASVKINNRSVLFELPDFKHDEGVLRKSLLNFIKQILSGAQVSEAEKMVFAQ